MLFYNLNIRLYLSRRAFPYMALCDLFSSSGDFSPEWHKCHPSFVWYDELANKFMMSPRLLRQLMEYLMSKVNGWRGRFGIRKCPEAHFQQMKRRYKR